MKTREFVLLLILFTMMCGAGYYYFFYIPLDKELAAMSATIEQKELELNAAQARAVKWTLLEKSIENNESTIARLNKNLPANFDQKDIITRLERILPGDMDVSITFEDKAALSDKTKVNTVGLSFFAEYDTFLSILRLIAADNTENRVVSLRYTGDIETGLSVNMEVDFLTAR